MSSLVQGPNLIRVLRSTAFYLFLGNVASLVAGVVIEALLLRIYLNDIRYLFGSSAIALLASLFPIGLVAYIGYIRGTKHAEKVMETVSPLALLLAGIGVAAAYLGVLGVREAGLFIVTAYYVELVVGMPLSRGFAEVDETGAAMFLVGVSFFVLTLVLVLVDHRLAVLPLAGNTVRTAGFAKLLASARA